MLVVEDEMMILMMEEMLTELGGFVTAAATVAKALAKIDGQVFGAPPRWT
jgi:CheY-like chemotaxis protein